MMTERSAQDMRSLDRQASSWHRFAASLRPPAWALAGLAVIMCVAFPIYRLTCPRERYILHLSDDAYYYFSVAAHLAKGGGPTADGLTRTTGWHPLYGFILAGAHRLTSPSLDGFVKEAIALNAVLYGVAGVFLYLAGARLWGRFAGLTAALLWLANPYGVLIANQGLEGALYACTLSLLLWRLAVFLRASQTRRSYLTGCLLLGLCAGFTVLSRTDSVLLMPLLVLILLARPAAARSVSLSPAFAHRLLGAALFGGIVLAAYGAWLLYVYRHTGEFHQGSAAVKMEWRRYQMRDLGVIGTAWFILRMWGDYVLKSFLKVPAFKWILSGIPLLGRESRGARAERAIFHVFWLVPVVLGLAYSLLLDWTRAWYYLPGLLTLTLLSAGAAAALVARRTSCPAPLADAGPAAKSGGAHDGLRRLQSLVNRTAGLIAWAVVIESAVLFGNKVYSESKDADLDSEKIWALEMADWLERNVTPGTRVGVWHSGIIGYYTPNLNVINLDGLNNNDILDVLRSRKTLNQYWDEIGLALIVSQGRDKMGAFARQWGTKQLARWDKPPRRDNPAEPPSIEDQVLPQYIQRIVEIGAPRTEPAPPPDR